MAECPRDSSEEKRIEELKTSQHDKLGKLLEKNNIYKKVADSFGLNKREMKGCEDHKTDTGERFLEILVEKNVTITTGDFREKIMSADLNDTAHCDTRQEIIDLLNSFSQPANLPDGGQLNASMHSSTIWDQRNILPHSGYSQSQENMVHHQQFAWTGRKSYAPPDTPQSRKSGREKTPEQCTEEGHSSLHKSYFQS